MKKIIFIALFALFCISTSFAGEMSLATQRQQFIAAKQALVYHNRPIYLLLLSQLKDYPLYPYLVYADLTSRLDELSLDEVDNFLQTNDDPVLTNRFLTEWLLHLAKAEEWDLFLKYYQPSDSIGLTCLDLQALLAANQNELAFKQMPNLWLTGDTLSDACENSFAVWQQSGQLSSDLVWQRFQLALQKNNIGLVKKLITILPTEQKNLAQLTLKVYQSPLTITKTQLFLPLSQATIDIAAQGMMQLASINAPKASQIWPQMQRDFHFNFEQQQKIIRAIAISLARTNDPNANAWLVSINNNFVDPLTQEWRVRIALSQLNWPQVEYWIKRMNADERHDTCWIYWYARALAEQGHTSAANIIYRQLAMQVDYYGLLASQQLHIPYQPVIDTQNSPAQEMERVASMPAIQRARELYSLNMIVDARREWDYALTQLDKPGMKAAATLASDWGWYDRSLITIAKARALNNIKLRYPLAYSQQVIMAGKQLNIDPAWIYGIMHQESSFMFDAKSNVGALGLMQLMPQTAKILADISITNYELLNSSTNIDLGARYLKKLLGWYRGNSIAATAAYNIGPSRLNKWLALQKSVPQDVWVELLPWKETRNYVKAVMLGTALYQQELGLR